MEYLLDTLLESLLLFPFLFVCYVLIELVETWTSKSSAKRLQIGSSQVLLGSSVGLIPQCGFSVVATDLFAKKKIAMGTLIAVFIATSDEAFPVLLSHPDKAGALLPLLLIKFLLACLVGYIVYGIERKLIKNQSSLNNHAHHFHETKDHEHEHEEHKHEHEHDEQDSQEVHIGCCGHHIEETASEKTNTKAKLKRYLLHPLLHTLYIFAFILVINLAFSTLVHFIGEDKISAFLSGAKAFTPLLSIVIGLIPNCASSVILTNMYCIGSLPFGALLSGLIMNTGIAATVLFKQNKNFKQNLLILGILLLTSLIAGYGSLYLF